MRSYPNILAMLPQGWIWTTVGDLSRKIQYGTSEKPVNQSPGVIVLRMGNIKDGRLSFESIKFLPLDLPQVHDLLLQDGDVLFNRTNSAELVGKTAVYKGQYPKATFASYLIRVQVYETVCVSDFLSYFINSYYGRKYITSVVSQQVGQANVNGTKLSMMPVPLPPLAEQCRMVSRIEEILSELDASTEVLKRVQLQLKRYRQSVLKHAVEGKLTAEWREKHKGEIEPADELLRRILVERRAKWEEQELAKMKANGKVPKDQSWKKKYKEPEPPNTEGLPELPEGWCWATVDQVGRHDEQIVLTGPFGSNLGRGDFLTDGVPLLTIGCLRETGISKHKAMFISEAKAKELDRYRLMRGDLLFSRMATVGRAGFVTEDLEGTIFNYHLMRLRLLEAVCSPHFFLYYVRGASTVTNYVRDVNHGATRDGINTPQLLALPVSLPPLAEQRLIVDEVESRLSVLRRIEETVQTSLRRAEALRQAILRAAFAGQLVPQDPTDESASLLLKRIREEREEDKRAHRKRSHLLKKESRK